MNKTTRSILKAIHPASLILSGGAVMGGLTASVIRGGISVFPAIMTLLFAILLQISANLYHSYFHLCYSGGDRLKGLRTHDSKIANSPEVAIYRIVANSFAILALTAGMSLFTFIGWIGMGYVVVISVMYYFYFMGPNPLVRTRWSLIFTFLFFGPIAVSGTALIQNLTNPDWLPIAVYSVINGMLAVNAHIAIQYMHYEEDKKNNYETLVTAKGGSFSRFVYFGNAAIVCIVLIIRPSAVEYVSPWVGIIIGICLLVSSIWVFSMMHRNPVNVSKLIRSVTLWQYLTVVIVLMAIVMYSVDHFRVNVFHFL
ncbi:MAG: prenyltransferase [Muribaculaceae bacterium]|nr:prenyltransferase [Muribaculaceae bacterium]